MALFLAPFFIFKCLLVLQRTYNLKPELYLFVMSTVKCAFVKISFCECQIKIKKSQDGLFSSKFFGNSIIFYTMIHNRISMWVEVYFFPQGCTKIKYRIFMPSILSAVFENTTSEFQVL